MAAAPKSDGDRAVNTRESGCRRSGLQPQSGAEPALEHHAILLRQHARGLAGRDRHAREQRSGEDAEPLSEAGQILLVDNIEAGCETTTARDRDEIDARRGMARLAAGLAIDVVVEHDHA